MANYMDKERIPDPIELRLKQLKGRSRLGIHIWEGETPGVHLLPEAEFPHELWKRINKIPAEQMSSALLARKVPINSISILPREKEMEPYGSTISNNPVGYLVNLDQDQLHPPIIVRVALDNLGSGTNSYNKNPHLGNRMRNTPIDDLYQGLPDLKAVIQAAVGENGRRFIEAQLDTLGQCYENSKSTTNNEGLCAFLPEHIETIVVADCLPSPAGDHYRLLGRLLGAVAGLQHLEKDIHLPVVTYRGVSPETGKISLLAHGPQALTSLLLESIGKGQRDNSFTHIQIQKKRSGREEHYKAMCERIFGTTGIDIEKPIAEQRAAIGTIKDRAVSLTPREGIGKN